MANPPQGFVLDTVPEGFEVQQFPAIGTRGNAPGESILNPDGTSSSERTISVGFGDITKLIPTIVPDEQGFLVKRSNEDAIELFRQGKNPSVGDFGSQEEADAFAKIRSERGGRSFQQFSDVPEGFVIDQIESTQPRTLSEGVFRRLTGDQRLARISALETEQTGLEQPSFLRDVVGQSIADLRGVPEAALDFGVSGATAALGGAAAIPVTAFDALRGGDDPAGAGRAVIERFQEKGEAARGPGTTDVGKRATAAIQAPLGAFEQFADVAGDPRTQAPTGEPQLGDPIRVGDPDFDALRGSPLSSTLVKTAILGAPALFGVRRGAVTTKPAPKPTPRQQVAASGAKEGYVTPPSVRGEAGKAGLAEGLGGKIKTGQQAIEANQAVTNKLASRAVGLPEEVPVTIDVLQGIRQQAGQAYEAVRGVGQVFTDTVFRRDLSAATARFRSAAKDFPELAKSEILDIVDSLRVSKFDAGSGIDAINLLRNRADVAFRGGDKTLGNSYRAAADAVEGVMERHLGRGGNPALVDGFKQARQQIAETYSVQEALQGRITGEVSATQLAAQLKKGKPLSGDLLAIAEFANTFPTVSRLFTGTAQAFSPLDLAVGGTSLGIAGTGLALGAGPAGLIPLAGTVARPLLRKAALSERARRSGRGKESTRPKASAVGGGLLSAQENGR